MDGREEGEVTPPESPRAAPRSPAIEAAAAAAAAEREDCDRRAAAAAEAAEVAAETAAAIAAEDEAATSGDDEVLEVGRAARSTKPARVRGGAAKRRRAEGDGAKNFFAGGRAAKGSSTRTAKNRHALIAKYGDKSGCVKVHIFV